MSEQQPGICHFMSVSLYLQPVLGQYGWIKDIIFSSLLLEAATHMNYSMDMF